MWVQSIKPSPVYTKGISVFASIDGSLQFFLPVLLGKIPESEINSAEFW